MGGHSHWATIKRHKGAQDAKRGKIFTRIIRGRHRSRSGGYPGWSSAASGHRQGQRSQYAGDTMKKAVQRGTGELPGVTYEEFSLEGWAGGTALL